MMTNTLKTKKHFGIKSPELLQQAKDANTGDKPHAPRSIVNNATGGL